MLGALALLVRGFETYVYSKGAETSDKGRWVTSIGAKYLSAEELGTKEVGEHIGNIDLVYEATGAPGLAFEMLGILGVNGVYVFTGVPGQGKPTSVNTSELMRSMVLKNQIAFGTVNAAPSAFQQAIADLTQFYERWPDAVRKLITGRYPPEQIEDLLIKPSFGIKRVVRFAES
jgi:threonine dehydrogenase-like Zn-dependent dehydrogenase